MTKKGHEIAHVQRSFFVKKDKENRKLQRVTAAYSLVSLVVSRSVCYSKTSKMGSMAEKLDPKELATFEELLISSSIQIEAWTPGILGPSSPTKLEKT